MACKNSRPQCDTKNCAGCSDRDEDDRLARIFVNLDPVGRANLEQIREIVGGGDGDISRIVATGLRLYLKELRKDLRIEKTMDLPELDPAATANVDIKTKLSDLQHAYEDEIWQADELLEQNLETITQESDARCRQIKRDYRSAIARCRRNVKSEAAKKFWTNVKKQAEEQRAKGIKDQKYTAVQHRNMAHRVRVTALRNAKRKWLTAYDALVTALITPRTDPKMLKLFNKYAPPERDFKHMIEKKCAATQAALVGICYYSNGCLKTDEVIAMDRSRVIGELNRLWRRLRPAFMPNENDPAAETWRVQKIREELAELVHKACQWGEM